MYIQKIKQRPSDSIHRHRTHTNLKTTATIPRKDLPVIQGHIIPTFAHSLIGVRTLCYVGFKVELSQSEVVIYNPDNKPIITGGEKGQDPNSGVYPLSHPKNLFSRKTPNKNCLVPTMHTTYQVSNHLYYIFTLRLASQLNQCGSNKLRQGTKNLGQDSRS